MLMHNEQLKTGIHLDTLEKASKQDYFEIYTHPSMLASVSVNEIPKTLDDAAREIRLHAQFEHNGRGKYWGIYSAQRLIGLAGLHSWNLPNESIEVSYEIHPEFRGQGIATASLRYMLKYALKYFKIKCVYAYMLKGNEASKRVAEKAGTIMINTHEKNIFFNGKWHDRWVFIWSEGCQ